MKNRQTRRASRFTAGSLESGRLHLSLSEAPFAEFERTFLTHQEEWLREARTSKERLAIKQRTAEDILLGAYGRQCTWEEFSRALRRTEKLGYANAGRRAHIACLLALSVKQFPAQAARARRLLGEAERHLYFMRKDHPVRKEYLKEIQRIRRLAGWVARGRQERATTPRLTSALRAGARREF
jgi:hypothetical protein